MNNLLSFKVVKSIMSLFLLLGLISFCYPESPACHENIRVTSFQQYGGEVSSVADPNACPLICVCSMTCFHLMNESDFSEKVNPIFKTERLLRFQYNVLVSQFTPEDLVKPPIA